ncbi:CHAT domain-containing protein [Winogradskyella sp.]|uniref:CHAT domain-containing protein n=1 Tax=Winogradskyella sp. TaxID=1883156 RepID=UPI0025D34E0B|nr:CHAT domain-containing protein [Winogradskyella sp.]
MEEKIYASTEQFYSEPNHKNLQVLNTEIASFEPQLKTKDEYFAFINLIINKAYYLAEHNTQDKAISAYEKAYKIYLKNQVFSYDIVEYCLIPLGVLYHKSNAYIKAENIIKHYITLAIKQGNVSQQISGSINLALLYQSLNRHQSVISIVDKTLLGFKDIKKNQEQRLNSIKKRSLLLIESNQEKLLLDNDVIFNSQDDSEILDLKYRTALQNRDYSKAYNYFNRIKNKSLVNNLISKRELAKLSFQEAQLFYLLNRADKAHKELYNTLSLLIPSFRSNQSLTENDLYPENIFIDVFDLLATIETTPENKLLNYNLSFYVTSLLNKENTNEESLIISASANRTRAENCIEILYQLYIKENNTDFIQRALNFAEQYKASILKTNSQRKSFLQKYGKIDSTLIREDLLLKEQKQLTNRLLSGTSNTDYLKRQDSIRSRLIGISVELKSLQNVIEQTYKIGINKTISLTDITSKLNDTKKAVIQYFYGKKAIYQFVFTETNYGFNEIPVGASTNQKIIDFISYFNDVSKINSDISIFTEDAFYIYNLLKFDAVKSFEEVVIIPDGLMSFIPFETLLNSKTTSTSFAKMPFVIKSQSLEYNTSLQFYLNNRTERLEDKLLGMFPVFKNSNQELTYTKNEAEEIKSKISSKLLMYEHATRVNFLNQMKNYSVLHLSTHASSGDFLNPANISFYDTELSVNELYDLDINPNLVVLSACETGVGKVLKGEGVMSIARGFQYAGAENTLFSLWQINDLSTSKIMTSFYKYYASGKTATFSNSQSKIDYLSNREVSNAKKSPYYWGAFVFYGDVPELKPNKQTYYLLTLGILALLIVVFLILKIFSKNAS